MYIQCVDMHQDANVMETEITHGHVRNICMCIYRCRHEYQQYMCICMEPDLWRSYSRHTHTHMMHVRARTCHITASHMGLHDPQTPTL